MKNNNRHSLFDNPHTVLAKNENTMKNTKAYEEYESNTKLDVILNQILCCLNC